MLGPPPPPVPVTYCPQCGKWGRFGYTGVCYHCAKENERRYKRSSASYASSGGSYREPEIPTTLKSVGQLFVIGVVCIIIGGYLSTMDWIDGLVGIVGAAIMVGGAIMIIYCIAGVPFAIIDGLIKLFKK